MEWFLADNVNPGSRKHTAGWLHPVFAFFLGMLCSPVLGFYGSDYLDATNVVRKELRVGEQYTNVMLGYFIIGYHTVLIIVRVFTMGFPLLYEQLWACNLAMPLAAVGIVTGRPIMVGAACLAVAIDQILWYVDVFSRICFGRWSVGVAKYMDWPETTLVTKLTSVHHLWFLPLCLWHLRSTKCGMPIESFILSSFGVCVMSGVTRLVVPFKIKKSTLSHRKKSDGDGLQYSNVNMTHEFWKDIPVALLHKMDGAKWYFYIPYLMVVYNILHWPFYILMKLLTEA